MGIPENLISLTYNSHFKALKIGFRGCPYELAQTFEFHYTPVHGSWLNIAECELSSLAKECLGKQRINCLEALNEILTCWETDRNARQKGVNWQFNTQDARTKLKHLYPTPLFDE